jgi:phosphoribosylformylglycinamidine synthase
VCRYVKLRVENADTHFTGACRPGEVLNIPIAHGDGNYFVDPETVARLESNHQIVFRYCDGNGETTEEANPNGSLGNIAGIMNEDGNVLGMMPHPERAVDPLLRHTDGQKIFQSIINSHVSRRLDVEYAGLSHIAAGSGRR